MLPGSRSNNSNRIFCLLPVNKESWFLRPGPGLFHPANENFLDWRKFLHLMKFFAGGFLQGVVEKVAKSDEDVI